jgi:amino-acid N-acetyltransferase
MLFVMIAIETASGADIAGVHRLLSGARLPVEGLDPRVQLLVARRDDRDIVGSAALEEYPGGALLRSVAVAEELRGEGLGQRLTAAALDLARQRGHARVYLLTTTAAAFFPRFGFTPIARADVPDDVRGSVEFTSACPSSALVMRADL